MTNVDNLIVESIINDDDISDFNSRLDRYDGEINEADAAVIAQYSENLSSRAVDDMHDSVEALLDENYEALENSQRIGLDNTSEIRVSQEMIQTLGGDVDRVERKVDQIGMSIRYEETRDHITAEHEETRETVESNSFGRRDAIKYGGSGILATILGVGAAGEILGWGDTGSGQPSNQVTKASITNVDEIGNYLEDRVKGNEMLSAEANWGDLLSEYEDGEFFPESDRSLEGLDVTLNPDGHSEYGISMDINGKTDYETRTLREDKAAENALEYFGEL